MTAATSPARSRLDYTDHRSDRDAWARALGVSREAIDVYLASDVIDLHVDSFIWTRIFGYDLRRRHLHETDAVTPLQEQRLVRARRIFRV